MHLPGHLQVIPVDWVVPAFNINRSLESTRAQLRNNVRPIGITETWRTVESVIPLKSH
jgi:hypothetical protein